MMSSKRFYILLAVIGLVASMSAQIHSPFYTGNVEVSPDVAVDVTVGNIYAYNNKREFPQKKLEADVTEEVKASTNLGIGGTYAGDYYTFIAHAAEAGTYDVTFQAAVKSDARKLWLYQSADEIADAPSATGDDAAVNYSGPQVGDMPVTGSWTRYQPLTFRVNLKAGYNLLKFVFDERWGGNVGSIKITKYTPPAPSLYTLTVGGKDILGAFDDSFTYTLSLPQGTTALPKVEATANELATVVVTQASISDKEPVANVKLYDKATGDLLKTYIIKYVFVNTVNGFSFTWSVGDGMSQTLSDDSQFKSVRTSTINSNFAIKSTASKVYSDNRFKIRAGEIYQLVIPHNAVVERVIFTNCSENYYNAEKGENTDSQWDYISSEGATSVISNEGKIQSAANDTASFSGHQAGTPILFSVKKCAQVAYSSIIIEYSQVNDGAIGFNGINDKDGDTKSVSGTFVLSFDRDIHTEDSTAITIDNKTVRSTVNGNKLTAYYWDLPYSTNHEFRVAANAIADIFNNRYGKDIMFLTR